MSKNQRAIHSRWCDVRGVEGDIFPGLCPVGRGGVHDPEPVPVDLFGPVPALPAPAPVPKPSAKASKAGRMLRAHRRDALEAGRRRGAKAAEHAERTDTGWIERASALTIEYGLTVKEFLIEEARAYAEGMGLSPPPDERAWGGVASRLSRKGQIVRVRFDTDGYGSPKSVWRVA